MKKLLFVIALAILCSPVARAEKDKITAPRNTVIISCRDFKDKRISSRGVLTSPDIYNNRFTAACSTKETWEHQVWICHGGVFENVRQLNDHSASADCVKKVEPITV